MERVQTSALAVWLLLAAQSISADINYCHNPAVNADWERLIAKHEGDPDYTRLYTLRKQMCADVDAGRMRLDEAIDRFEAERERIINERLERLEQHYGVADDFG